MALTLTLTLTGCTGMECGPGTVAEDDLCVTRETDQPTCGADTEFDPVTGLCTNPLTDEGFGACGEGTDRVVLEDGSAVCIGSGGIDCDRKPACPPPAPGRVTICGRLHDLGTLEAVGSNAEPLPPDELAVEIWEPLSFVQGNPLRLGEATVNCGGWFVARDVFPQASQLLAIGVDDGEGQPDEHVLAGIAFEAVAGQTVADLAAFTVTHALDEGWTESAGAPFGAETFAQHGVYVPIFIDTTQPAFGPFNGSLAEGVTIYRAGAPAPGQDFYFGDDAPGTFLTVDAALDASGPAGGGLFTGSPGTSSFTAQGGEPPGCSWPTDPAGTVPEIVFVQLREASCD